MQPLSGSAGPPAGEPLDISGEQRDQYQDVLIQGGSVAISSAPSLMMLETGTFDAASAMVLGAYVAQGLELEQDMSVVQLSANAASAFTVAPPCISTSISSTSTAISTTVTQYCSIGYSHEEGTLVPWETSPATPPLQHRPDATEHEEAMPMHSAVRNFDSRDSVEASAERPAAHSRTGDVLGDLRSLLEQRYHTPGFPRSAGRSGHVHLRNSAIGKNSVSSAEQPASSREAAMSVPKYSGYGQYNPQSGDFVSCHGAKPPPPVLKAPPPRQQLDHRVVPFKAPPPNSSLPLETEGFHNATTFMHGHLAPREAFDLVGNRQEPRLPSKAAPQSVPRRFQFFSRPSSD